MSECGIAPADDLIDEDVTDSGSSYVPDAHQYCHKLPDCRMDPGCAKDDPLVGG